MISDQTWRFLEPSTENFESVTKDEVQAGLESGDFALFESPRSKRN